MRGPLYCCLGTPKMDHNEYNEFTYEGLSRIIEESLKYPSFRWVRRQDGSETRYYLNFYPVHMIIGREKYSDGSVGYSFSFWNEHERFTSITYDFRTNNPIKKITDKLDRARPDDKEYCLGFLKKCGVLAHV